MYFVTMKRAGYCLFAVSPSERFGVGLLDDQQRVHVLEREGADYVVRQDWAIGETSHTDVMLRLRDLPEPATVAEFVRAAKGG